MKGKTLLIALGYVLLGSPMALPANIWKISFEDEAPGQLPKGFSCPAGRWTVATETVKGGKSNRYLSSLSGRTVALFNTAGKMGTVSAQVRVLLDGPGKSGGILVKYFGENDYLALVLGSDGYLKAIRRKGNEDRVLNRFKYGEPQGKWVRIQVFANDRGLVCKLEDMKVLEVRDKIFGAQAQVGLVADGEVRFDNFSIGSPR